MNKINRAMNIVIPVETSGSKIFVHSAPITTETFDIYFMTLSKTHSMFDTERMWTTAPRMAYRMLRQVAMETPRRYPDGTTSNWWDGLDGVENGLMNDIRQRTNVILPQQGAGWTTIPFADDAVRKSLDSEDIRDVESLLVFFTVLSASPLDRRGREEFLEMMATKGLRCHVTSLNATEFSRSPEISKLTEDSGKKDHTS